MNRPTLSPQPVLITGLKQFALYHCENGEGSPADRAPGGLQGERPAHRSKSAAASAGRRDRRLTTILATLPPAGGGKTSASAAVARQQPSPGSTVTTQPVSSHDMQDSQFPPAGFLLRTVHLLPPHIFYKRVLLLGSPNLPRVFIAVYPGLQFSAIPE